jgi:hypothetical protein
VTFTHGPHTFKAGANVIRREVDFFQGNDSKGYFVIGGVNFPGTGRFTGYETSELLSGFSDYHDPHLFRSSNSPGRCGNALAHFYACGWGYLRCCRGRRVRSRQDKYLDKI